MSASSMSVVTPINTQSTRHSDVVIKMVGADAVFPELGAQFAIAACENTGGADAWIPREPTGYFVPKMAAKKMLLWSSTPSRQALLLKGETGTGKTELAHYLAARLGIPLASLEINPHMTPEVIDGSMRLVSDGAGGVITRHQMSEVALRYKHGGWILLDEVDKVGDELQSRLHAVIDGKPITIPDTGEVIYKHPACRVIGTANTVGDGTSERYLTSRGLDEAFRSRWAVIELQYLSPSDELNMLMSNYPKLKKGFLSTLVAVANSARDAALGPKRDGDVNSPMMSVMSTRVLRNILDNTMMFGAGSVWMESVNFAYRDMLTTTDKYTLDGILQRHFGDLDGVTTKDLMAKIR